MKGHYVVVVEGLGEDNRETVLHLEVHPPHSFVHQFDVPVRTLLHRVSLRWVPEAEEVDLATLDFPNQLGEIMRRGGA